MHRRQKNERGAAAVEFAIVLPILLLILFGMINFGVVFAQNLALSNAARQAARFGSVAGNACDDIVAEAEQTVTDEMIAFESGILEATAVTREPGGGGCAGEACTGSAEGDSVRVTMTYEANFLVPWLVPGIPQTVDIEGEGEFRCEYS